jgi:Family of unknown function (DUF5681)
LIFPLNSSEHIRLWYHLATDDDDEIAEDEPVEQPKNSQKNRAAHLAPWQFKKGQSGNPLGRTPGKSTKEFAKEYLTKLTDEERIEYFEGMNKADIWKMAEGISA